MDPLAIYDYLVLSRARVLGWVRGLGEEGSRRPVGFGLGTVSRTLAHVLESEWYYVQRIEGWDERIVERPPVRSEDPPALAEIEAAWSVQKQRTRKAVDRAWGGGSSPAWTRRKPYRLWDDHRGLIEVIASPSEVFTQLAMHEVHHRAQVMAMLRVLGAIDPQPEDIDFNTMTYGASARPVA